MKNKNKKASIFVYVLILINVALIIGYVVFNNTYILNNNINIGKNAEEVFLKLSDKGNINIESVRQYNNNGDGFSDFMSCPTNVTMSGIVDSQSGMVSEMNYDFGTVYCILDYIGEPVRIFFDDQNKNFTNVFFKGKLKEIKNRSFTTGTEITGLSIYNSTPPTSSTYAATKSINGNNYGDQYRSQVGDYTYITYNLGSEQKISKIRIYRNDNSSSNWTNGEIKFKDGSHNVLYTSIVSWGPNSSNTYKDIILDHASYASAEGVQYIEIRTKDVYKYLTISEFEVFGLVETGTDLWSIDGDMGDTDRTFFSFDSTGIGGNDSIDDDMNSDNYRSSSTGTLGYPGDHLDDDIVPRTTIFGNVSPNTSDYFNVFWNNYLTNNMINANVYNNDNPLRIVKIGDVEEGYLIFDLFSKTELPLSYNLKIIEFDRDSYEKEFTLLPTAIYETTNLSDNYGYLQLNGDALSLSTYKTGNEFKFNFKDKDYSIYFTNSLDTNMAIRITGEEKQESGNLTELGKQIFINPIDDSKEGLIETIVNHIIIGGEKNFIGENFKVIGSK